MFSVTCTNRIIVSPENLSALYNLLFFNDSPGNKATYATNKVIGSKTHSMKWSLKWMSPPQGDREVTQLD